MWPMATESPLSWRQGGRIVLNYLMTVWILVHVLDWSVGMSLDLALLCYGIGVTGAVIHVIVLVRNRKFSHAPPD
jgi:hypothetical protein